MRLEEALQPLHFRLGEIERPLQHVVFEAGAKYWLAGFLSPRILAVQSDRGHRSGLAGVHLKVNQASGKQTDVARLQRVIPQPVVLSVHEGDIELTLQQHQNFAGAGMPVRQVYPTGFEIDSPRSETLSVQSWKLGCGCEGRYRAGERRGAFGRFA